MTARWRCRCSSTGVQAQGLSLPSAPRARGGAGLSGRLEIEIAHNGDMIRWTFPSRAHSFDADTIRRVAGLRASSRWSMRNPGYLPATHDSPRMVLARAYGRRANASVRAKAAQRLEAGFRGWRGRNRAVGDPAAGLCKSSARNDVLKVSREHQRLVTSLSTALFTSSIQEAAKSI